MARDLHADTLTALADDVLRPANFVKMEFDSADVNVWSGLGEYTLDGDVYTGLGNLGGISAVSENTNLSSNPVDFTLNGIPTEYVSLALQEPYQGKPITYSVAFLDSSGAVYGESFQMFKGLMDVMSIKKGVPTSNITLRAESVLRRAERPGVRKMNPQHHMRDRPLDKFFIFLNNIQNKELIFGPSGSREPAKKQTAGSFNSLQPWRNS